MGRTDAIARALEVFVQGFSFTRSFTHPYLGERVGPLWVMRDAPRPLTRQGKPGKYRTEEWVACGIPSVEIDRIVRKHARGRFAICVLRSSDEPREAISVDAMRAEFKEMSYRLMSTEPLMIHSLKQIPSFEEPAAIERVSSQEMADRVNKAARSRQILPEHLRSDGSLAAPMRQYVALVDGELVGRGASVTTGDATWVSNMFVRPELRRRGIARSIMSRMLRDDREAGALQSVLLASHTGAMLYPVVGYEQIGTLYTYTGRLQK